MRTQLAQTQRHDALQHFRNTRLKQGPVRLGQGASRPHQTAYIDAIGMHQRNPTRSAQMGFISEFKQFAVKGNVIDLAVGVIIGGAFGKIVDSTVNDLIMPLISKVVGGLDFSNYYIALADQPVGMTLVEAKKVGAVFAYGNFITVALNFMILAFIIFLMIKQINRLKNEAPPAPTEPAPTPEEIVLLREIRDNLKK
jgi:large conductance mechanosensitive channel